ncbi:MAG: ABC transporter [Legionellales bacterium]|nr:ABC transporter [Legionellales bacterium]|tara:strand:- start:1027 stop:1956 length:930 start_codon:yes stop_codon:yes gene_type:complete
MSKLALSIDSLNKTYDKSFKALSDVSFSVEEGDFFALLGPNGAGKSTTIGILSTLVKKDSGSVIVSGLDLDKDPLAVKRNIGVVPQEFNFPIFDKVEDIVINQAGYYGVPYRRAKENAMYFLKNLDLWDKRHVQAGKLSGGMKRRLMIARGMIHEPKLLLLDEPTAGVDVEMRRTTWSFLRKMNEHGVTIILTTHYLEEAEALCRNLAVIDKGKIKATGEMQALLRQQQNKTFIIECTEPVTNLPEVPGYDLTLNGSNIIQVTCGGDAQLNPILTALAQANADIQAVRPSTNRLEQFFLDLVGSKEVSS